MEHCRLPVPKPDQNVGQFNPRGRRVPRFPRSLRNPPVWPTLVRNLSTIRCAIKFPAFLFSHTKFSNKLLFFKLFKSGELCVDERPAVRKSSGQTLFSTIAAHSNILSKYSWDSVMWQVRGFPNFWRFLPQFLTKFPSVLKIFLRIYHNHNYFKKCVHIWTKYLPQMNILW